MAVNTISYGDIKISGYQLLSIVGLRIVQAINEHAQMEITGMVSDDLGEGCLQEFEINMPIEVKKGDVVLFNGIIVELEVSHINSKYYISIGALSHTYKMDIVKESRSFQDPKMKYRNLVESVISKYGKTNFMDMSTDDALIENPIIQYKESDWEFLKRMASRFYTVLIPHCMSEGVNFYLGLSNVDKGEIEAYDGIDVISKDGLVFMTLNDDGTVTLNSNDKISFTAENDIEMKARNVNIEATDHIKIEAKESSIDLESDITVTGKEVKTN